MTTRSAATTPPPEPSATSTRAGAAGVWKTNASVDDVASALCAAKTVVITTHGKPDGDAIGSTIALARTLMACGVGIEVWYIGPVAGWTAEFTRGVKLREFAPGKPAATEGLPDPDVSVVVDTGSWNQVAELKPWLSGRSGKMINIDHHLHGDAELSARRIVETACASCTQVLAPLCVKILGVGSAAKLPLEIAEPLYLGLATDTGWLRYSNVTPSTLRLAAELIEAGVDHTRLYRVIEQQDQPSRWRLLGRALNSLKLEQGGRVATMVLSLKDFAETGSDATETSGFADMVLSVSTVEVSAVLTETAVGAGEPPLTKISFRSKPGPNAVDVNAVANTIGGGGHARAAGAKTRTDLEAARALVVEKLR